MALPAMVGKDYCFPSLSVLSKYWQDPSGTVDAINFNKSRLLKCRRKLDHYFPVLSLDCPITKSVRKFRTGKITASRRGTWKNISTVVYANKNPSSHSTCIKLYGKSEPANDGARDHCIGYHGMRSAAHPKSKVRTMLL